MAFGQPFYNYGTNPYGGQNNGFMGQQPQYGNFYGQPKNAPYNPNNGVQQQYQQQVQQQAPQMAQVPPKTNIAPVISLMDALNRAAEPNTNLFYADQDNPLIYLVSTDMQGRKTYRTFKIDDVTEQTTKASESNKDIDLSGYAKKEDLQTLKDEIMGMASAFMAQQSVQTNAQPPSRGKSGEKPKVDKE